MDIATLMERRNDWIERTGKFMNSLPIVEHERYAYLPSYYKTLSWFDQKLGEAYQDALGDNVFAVEVKKKEYLVAEKI